MYPELTDEALTDLLKSDDPLALETLFDRYYKTLCQFCAVYTKDYAVAEEIIADIFIKLWDNRKETDILKIKNYLFVSARNQSINYKEKKKDPVDLVERFDLEQHLFTDKETPFRILSGRESYQRILLTIDQLPLRQREVLLMSRFEHFDKQKIAEILGISVRTVETTLYQSIKQLRELLKNSSYFNSGS